MQPCSLKRQLKLFPKLQRAKLKTNLGANSPLWQELPAQFSQVQKPCLWKAGTQLTLIVIATACLTAMFMSLRYEAMHTGYWMAKASAQQEKQLRAGQQRAGYHSNTDCKQWWKDFMKDSYKSMTEEQKEKLNQEAALALFRNPPVSKAGAGSNKHACMCLRQGTGSGRHIEWNRGYPFLVLQHACVSGDGVEYKKIRVAAHQLVALFFLGPKSEVGCSSQGVARRVVCHYDIPPSALKVEWQLNEMITPNIKRCDPVKTRCVSTACVCPVCVHYDTQSNNAKTGKQWTQLMDKRSKQKL